MGKTQTTIRIDDHLLAQADELSTWIAQKPYVRMLGAVGRSVVLRIAVERGLAVLEHERQAERRTELSEPSVGALLEQALGDSEE